MTVPVLLVLDGRSCRALCDALHIASRELRRNGQRLPPRLDELAAALSAPPTGGQGAAKFDAAAEVSHDPPVVMMGIGEVARCLSLSVSSVRRRVADGTIRSVKVGGRRLIRVADLEALQ